MTGVAVLIGWVFHVALLTTVLPGARVMVPHTAVTFIVCGLAMFVSLGASPSASRPLGVLRFALGVPATLGLATLAEYALGIRFGVERWLGLEAGDSSAGEFAGRFSPNAAAAGVLLSAAVWALRAESARLRRLGQAAAATLALATWLALLGFVFDTGRLANEPRFPGMALHTALGLFGLALALVFEPRGLFRGRLRSDTAGGLLRRRLLPAAFGGPLVIGWLTVTGEHVGWFDTGLTTAIMAIGLTAIVAVVVFGVAEQLDRSSEERMRAEAALRAVHDDLERRVAERTRELAATNRLLLERIDERERLLRERRDLLEGERAARRRAEEGDRLKDEFFATLSHELRTPLSAILGWTHLLRQGGLDDDASARALAAIERAVSTQRQLVDDLLDMSRLVAGREQLALESVDVATVVDRVVELTRPTALAKRITLDVRTGRGAVIGDATRLRQSVWHLVHNALKFTPNGGTVRIEQLTRDDLSQVLVRVHDTGIGIETSFIPHVFDVFRQADGSTRRRYGGLGLGLAIVRHVAELHGGDVVAESSGAGTGATFTLVLPMADAGRADAETHPAADRAAAVGGVTLLPAGLRALTVDQDGSRGELLVAILRALAVEGRSAVSARVAAGVMASWLPDVILVDVDLPRTELQTLTRVARAPELSAPIPLVGVATTSRDDRAKSDDDPVEFDAVVAMPITARELARVLASVVEGRRAGPGAPSLSAAAARVSHVSG